jgi:hypothetical protein
MDAGTVSAVNGVIGALLGALVTGVIAWRVAAEERKGAANERETERREQQVYGALQYFTGGTQNRNVGIAVIERYLTVAPELQVTFMPLLINQAIYLLTKSKQVNADHERNNLRRIMNLVLDGPDDPGIRRLYTDLCDVVTTRLSAIPADQPKRPPDPGLLGVEVEKRDLVTWRTGLGCT